MNCSWNPACGNASFILAHSFRGKKRWWLTVLGQYYVSGAITNLFFFFPPLSSLLTLFFSFSAAAQGFIARCFCSFIKWAPNNRQWFGHGFNLCITNWCWYSMGFNVGILGIRLEMLRLKGDFCLCMSLSERNRFYVSVLALFSSVFFLQSSWALYIAWMHMLLLKGKHLSNQTCLLRDRLCLSWALTSWSQHQYMLLITKTVRICRSAF